MIIVNWIGVGYGFFYGLKIDGDVGSIANLWGYYFTTSVRLLYFFGVLVPLWFTIFYLGGTQTQRDTKNFVEDVVQ